MRTQILLIILCVSYQLSAQNFINGSFENNSALGDSINLTQVSFGSLISDCFLSGTSPNADLITSAVFCGANAVDGDWYVGITGGGTDIVSMQLDAPLVTGNSYTIYFYERYCDPFSIYDPNPMEIGCSTSASGFGTTIYNGVTPIDQNWNLRSFTFTAPDNSQYITVQLSSGTTLDTWSHVDGFSFSAPTGVEEQEKSTVLAYPNPNNGQFTIDLADPGHVELFDQTGRIILSEPLLAGSNQLFIEVQPGIYYYRVIGNGVSAQMNRLVVR